MSGDELSELARLARAVTALRDSAVSDVQRLAYENALEEIAFSVERMSDGGAA